MPIIQIPASLQKGVMSRMWRLHLQTSASCCDICLSNVIRYPRDKLCNDACTICHPREGDTKRWWQIVQPLYFFVWGAWMSVRVKSNARVLDPMAALWGTANTGLTVPSETKVFQPRVMKRFSLALTQTHKGLKRKKDVCNQNDC